MKINSYGRIYRRLDFISADLSLSFYFGCYDVVLIILISMLTISRLLFVHADDIIVSCAICCHRNIN